MPHLSCMHCSIYLCCLDHPHKYPLPTNRSFLCTMHSLQIKCTCELNAPPLTRMEPMICVSLAEPMTTWSVTTPNVPSQKSYPNIIDRYYLYWSSPRLCHKIVIYYHHHHHYYHFLLQILLLLLPSSSLPGIWQLIFQLELYSFQLSIQWFVKLSSQYSYWMNSKVECDIDRKNKIASNIVNIYECINVWNKLEAFWGTLWKRIQMKSKSQLLRPPSLLLFG